MELIYKYAESTVKPIEIEICKNTVFLRKDITEVDSLWVYQEAKMSHEEFNDYSKFLMTRNAMNGVNDSSNIVQLIAGQENGDNNQLIIMEAIADLYDAIANMM